MSDQEILEQVQALLPQMEWAPNEDALEKEDRLPLKGTYTEGGDLIFTLYLSRSLIGGSYWWQFLYVVGDHELMRHPDPTTYFETLEEAVDTFWDHVENQTREQRSIVSKLEQVSSL
jgi:hypothetical protein